MIDWTEIDTRLTAIGKDRTWLSQVTPYSWDTIRQALAPNGRARSDRMLTVLSRAIEDEESRRREPREIAPGIFQIFQTDEQIDRADRASRLVRAESLVDFCRDVILAEADRILATEEPTTTLRVAEPLPPYQTKPKDPDPYPS